VIRELAVFTDLGVVTDVAARTNHGPRTDDSAVFDYRVRLHAHVFSDRGSGADYR
jgi:hypothetical protein